MARNKTSGLQMLFGKDFNWQESYASLILGAIIVVVLGLLVANYFTKKDHVGVGEQTSQNQEQKPEEIKPEAKKEQEYKVVTGDSLSSISQKYYATYNFWPVLAKVNNIQNPNIIFVDTNLKIPAKVEVESALTKMTTTSYQVKEGDTLFKIAEEVYGDGSKWVVLDKANNVGRLPNGNPLIFAGNTLVIPR